MRSTLLFLWLAASGGAATPPAPQNGAGGGSIGLQELLRQARRRNPEILRAKERWKSAQSLVLAAGTWDDPVFGFGKFDMNTPGGTARMWTYSARQKIPFPGKLTAQSELQYHEARRAYDAYRGAELQVFSRVAAEYHKILWITRSIAILDDEARVMDAVARAAQAMLAARKARADEPISAQLRAAELRNDAIDKQGALGVEQQALKALLSLGAESPALNLKGEIFMPEPPDSLPSLLSAAKEHNPTISQTRHLMRHAEILKKLRLLDFAPDFTLNYTAAETNGMFSNMTSRADFTLPVWAWKQKGYLDSALKHKEAARAAMRAAENDVLRDVASRLIDFKTQRALALRYQMELVPLARSAFEIALKNYESGTYGFARLIQTFEKLLSVRLAYVEKLHGVGRGWARLERATGTELPLKEGSKK